MADMVAVVIAIQDEKTRDKTFELLVSKGANVNDQDSEGRTALSYACEMQCHGLVRILVRSNVDPDIPDIKGEHNLLSNFSFFKFQ
jgi:ankyrin repeat protein